MNDQIPPDRQTPPDGQLPPDLASDDERPSAAGPDQPIADPPPGERAEGAEAADAPADAGRARSRHRRIAALSVAAAVVFAAGAGGGAAASLALARSTTASTADSGSSLSQSGSSAGTEGAFGGSQGGFSGPRDGFGRSQGGFGSGSGSNSGSPSGSGTSTATAATSEQVTGLVTIVSELGYEDGRAAGTGIVLTAGGRILTNNHVIDGATAITVTVQSTGSSYSAEVVGTNATKDIAVLQLENATGLTAADLATGGPSVGDDVTAVGNANGTGTLSAAEGTITALDQTITTSSEGGTAGETLDGLIEIDADVVSGDSGGAVQNASGDVIGVTTAASSGTSDITGYAIPIDSALGVARQIVAGDDTDEITIGLPAFLGVSIASSAGTASSASGAVVGGVLDGTPAASSGIAAGDTITAIGGTAITSSDALSPAIARYEPGDRVQVDYTDASGASHTVTVTLAAGPAD